MSPSTEVVFYQVKTKPLRETDYKQLVKEVRYAFSNLKGGAKRKTYVRSCYFKKQKIFFDYFWEHLLQKPRGQRIWRLKLFPCALELIANSRCTPTVTTKCKSEKLYRFYGKWESGKIFAIQVKEHLPSKTKQMLSVFLWE